MNCNAIVHDVPMLRYCSVLGELSYIKGKAHENFMCQMQDRQGNLMAMCPVHFLTSRSYRKFPVLHD